jgi:hypothetical protein
MKEKDGFFTRVFILPVVNKIIQQQLDSNKSAASRQYEILGSEIVSIRSQMEQEVKQLNEVGKADLDDRATKLVTYFNEQITSLLDKYVALADRVEKMCDSIDTACNVIVTLRAGQDKQETSITKVIASVTAIKAELETAVRQSRIDTATAIKNTREKIADCDDKLDAFIDTVSEKLAQLKRRN